MTPFWLDSDLVAFALTIGGTLLRAPRRLQRREPSPAEYQPEEVPPGQLTEKQRQFFEPYDRKLAAMNYFPVCTYRISTQHRGLLRRYASPVDPAYFTMIAAEVKYHYKGRVEWAPTSLLTIRTDFTDGTALTTRNMKRKTLFDRQPNRTVQECPNVDDPAALKKKHDSVAEKMGCPQPFPSDVARVLNAARSEHDEFVQYQVKRRLYQHDPRGGYSLTNKAIWRGIRNHYNPFAQRITPFRMALCALLAVGIPAITFVLLQTTFPYGSAASPLSLGMEGEAILLASYLLAGASIALLIQRSPFLWAFLLTYLGVHLCTGWWTSSIPFALIAALTAFQVKRFRHFQRVMLQPRTASA